MMKIIKNNKGEGYIDTCVTVVVFMMLIAFSLNVFSFLTLKQDMDFFAKELTYTATSFGRIGTEVDDRLAELTEQTGITPTDISWETDYFDSGDKTVQYGDSIKVVITCKTKLQGFGAINLPMTVTSNHSGLSMKYWK